MIQYSTFGDLKIRTFYFLGRSIHLLWIFPVIFISCGETDNPVAALSDSVNKPQSTFPFKSRPQHPDWKEIRFSNWSMLVPQNFRIERKQGIDSNPGDISSDSITMHYDTDFKPGVTRKEICDPQEELSSLLNNKHDSVYYAKRWIRGFRYDEIDTLANLFCTITHARIGIYGTSYLRVQDCNSANGISIRADSLTESEQRLAEEIFRTIISTSK